VSIGAHVAPAAVPLATADATSMMATTHHGRDFATGAEGRQWGRYRSVLDSWRHRKCTSFDRTCRIDGPSGFLSHPSSFSSHGLHPFLVARYLTTLVATQFLRDRPKAL